MKTPQFNSIWDAVEDTSQEVASMQILSTLLIELAQLIDGRDLIPAQEATLFDVSQPRISDIKQGKINLFTLDMLIYVASTAGMSPIIKLTKPQHSSFKVPVS